MTIAIMDGRARFDTDRATVVSVCESVIEARKEMRRYYQGYDYVVVDLNTDEVVYDPHVKNLDKTRASKKLEGKGGKT